MQLLDHPEYFINVNYADNSMLLEMSLMISAGYDYVLLLCFYLVRFMALVREIAACHLRSATADFLKHPLHSRRRN